MYLPDVNVRLIGMWLFKAGLCEAVLGYFFYKSWWSALCLLPITLYLLYAQWQAWRKQVLLEIEHAFKDWLFYVKGGLSAGQSAEAAIIRSKRDFMAVLRQRHPFRLGAEQIYMGLELHVPLEECIRRMGIETQVEVIEDFAAVFEIARKQGGRMSAILEKTIGQIYDRVELRQELHAMLAAKKTEQRIMCVMPFGIMLFIGSASGGYFESMYHNLQGICIMTVCLLVYIVGVWWGERLTEIRI